MEGRRRRPFWYLTRSRRAVEADVDDEIRAHLEMRAAALRRDGWPAEEARREANRRFGDVAATRAYCRRQSARRERTMSGRLLLQDVWQDVRAAFRTLRRGPTLALAVLATVGVGIGATTAMFAAVDAALLRPLPYVEASRLVAIYTDSPPFAYPFSVADYRALQAEQRSFAAVAAYRDRAMSYSDGREAEVLRVREVSWSYCSLLGIRPVRGRDFTPADARPGAAPAALITDRFWRTRLQATADVPGARVTLDGLPYTVAGVLPAVTGPLEEQQDVFVAAAFSLPSRKGPFSYRVLGRLAEGVAPATALGELHAMNRRLFPVWRASYQDERATWGMVDLRERLTGGVRTAAGLALAAVALVWLIACVNASNLLLARVLSRRRELAVRGALGASRTRIVRHLLVESAVLAFGAAAVGAAVAWAGVQLLRGPGADYLPRTAEIALAGRTLWVLAGATLASAAIFGVIPAIEGTRSRVGEALQSRRGATEAPGLRRLRRILVGGQLAIATPLLIIGAVLLVSLNALRQVDLGFDPGHLLTAAIRLPPASYRSDGAVISYWDELARRVSRLPGVSGVAFSDSLPPAGASNLNNFDLEDAPTGPGESQPVAPFVSVTPEYFQLFGLTAIQGRLLEEHDMPTDALLTVVVDRAWAAKFFSGASAVGKRFHEGGCTSCPWTTVVGVVGDVRYAGLDQPTPGTVYTAMDARRSRFVAVRSAADPATLVAALRRTVRELDPTVPVTDVAGIDTLVADSLRRPAALSALVGGFAVVALVLVTIGVYGVMVHHVEQRGRDIGIRLALGGTRSRVLRTVVGEGMTLALAGVFAGLLAAALGTRWIASLLFTVRSGDPATYLVVTSVLLGMSLAACAIPARRAVVRPLASVLRSE